MNPELADSASLAIQLVNLSQGSPLSVSRVLGLQADCHARLALMWVSRDPNSHLHVFEASALSTRPTPQPDHLSMPPNGD